VIFGRRTTRHLLVPLALLGTIRRIERSQRRNHAAGLVPVLTVSLDVTPRFKSGKLVSNARLKQALRGVGYES
jgi:hypothetical protein